MQDHASPLDYLVIGHLSNDLTPNGPRLGGTAAFSALTARALGLRVGIVSVWGPDLSLEPLGEIPLAGTVSERSTSFENTATKRRRVQILKQVAPRIETQHIPDSWCQTPIIHLGPIAQEIKPAILRRFPNSKVFLTPQGWMRDWDTNGQIHATRWQDKEPLLKRSRAAVFSIEDLDFQEERMDALRPLCHTLVLTRGEQGARVFSQRESIDIPGLNVNEVDSTGAGDIFATAFFIHLNRTNDFRSAAIYANQLAAQSVTRVGLDSIPKPEEVQAARVKV